MSILWKENEKNLTNKVKLQVQQSTKNEYNIENITGKKTIEKGIKKKV